MKYTWHGTYEKRHIPKEAGFRWEPDGKYWYTEDASRAAKIKSYLSEDQQVELDKELAEKQESLNASHATNTDKEIPAPEGLAYLPYQKAGIVYASERKNTLFGDEMGLGKTIQAIGTINMNEGIKSVLVVCPASLKLNWQREIMKWLTRPLSISIANGTFQETDIVIINYDILAKHRDAIRKKVWSLLILDEVHYAKNPKAGRSKEIWGHKKGGIEPIRAEKILALTGTPILNKPVEMWPLLNHFGLFRSWKHYVTKFCNGFEGKWGWDVSGSSNLDELQGILRENCMVRRMKADVLKDLPPKRRSLIVLQQNGMEELVKKTNETENGIKENISYLEGEAEKAKDDDAAYKEAVEKLTRARRMAFLEMGNACHEIALAKVPYAINHITDILESTNKVVVFGHHHDVIDGLMAGLTEFNPVMFRGDMNQTSRDVSITRFMNDEKCRIFIGSIGAAGVGITLTSASTVVFVELDWVPGNLSQAEDRCHRIGQTGSVLVQHIVVDNSIDQRMAEKLVKKQAIIDAALNGKTESTKIEELKFENTPEENQISEPMPDNDKPVEKNRKEKIAEMAQTLTTEMIKEIHEKIRIVAGFDPDHASTQNGIGFSTFDGEIGHDLANREFLSPKQAAFGMMLVRKYTRQCGKLSWME